MAVNITTRRDNVKNIRSHALNGTKVRLSAKEIRTLRKEQTNDKIAA